jgi:hypothetical protein
MRARILLSVRVTLGLGCQSSLSMAALDPSPRPGRWRESRSIISPCHPQDLTGALPLIFCVRSNVQTLGPDVYSRRGFSGAGTTLLVVLSNPPLTTTGDRTLRRIALFKELFEVEALITANLFSIPTYRTGNLTDAGQAPDGWLGARSDLSVAIGSCTAVLLAYGAQEPSGSARIHFRYQVKMARDLMSTRNLPVWTVGGRPLHPTRWHRHTHRTYPDLEFREALKLSLLRMPDKSGTPSSLTP